MQTDLLNIDTSPIMGNYLNQDDQVNGGHLPSIALNGGVDVPSECSLHDRFDRKAVVAYEWGRSRLSLDVDGVSLGGGGERGVHLKYKIRFQPEKTKKQRCRYSSPWQGLVGSGYNELFVRKEDTVWAEIRDVKRSAAQYMDNFF